MGARRQYFAKMAKFVSHLLLQGKRDEKDSTSRDPASSIVALERTVLEQYQALVKAHTIQATLKARPEDNLDTDGDEIVPSNGHPEYWDGKYLTPLPTTSYHSQCAKVTTMMLLCDV